MGSASFMRIKEQVGKRVEQLVPIGIPTVKNTPIKQYIRCQSKHQEFWWCQLQIPFWQNHFVLQNKICVFLKQSISIYVGHSVFMKQSLNMFVLVTLLFLSNMNGVMDWPNKWYYNKTMVFFIVSGNTCFIDLHMYIICRHTFIESIKPCIDLDTKGL